MKVAVMADIHANIVALEAVWSSCEEESVDAFIVAGDLIGYYYWPRQVVRRLYQDSRVVCVRGNHEENLARCDDPTSARILRERYGSGYDVCAETLNETEKGWLLNLPTTCTVEFDGVSFTVHHGSPTSANEYIYPDADESTLLRSYSQSDFTVIGHTHYPMHHTHQGRNLINPGSVGQPRDFGGSASYAIVDTIDQSVVFRRIQFDVSQVVEEAISRDPQLPYLHTIQTRDPGNATDSD